MTNCSNLSEPKIEMIPVYNHNFLMENLAFIAFEAGYEQLYSGSFTDDFTEFTSWAEEFEVLYSKTDWNESEKDYYATIGEFTEKKIAMFKEKHKEV